MMGDAILTHHYDKTGKGMHWKMVKQAIIFWDYITMEILTGNIPVHSKPVGFV